MTPTLITVHCSANSNGSKATGEDIKRFHMAPPPKGRGWTDCGYHSVIEVDGGVFRGRPDNRLGAHVAGHNSSNLGVCLIGLNRFSQAQIDALRRQLDTWVKAYKIKRENLRAHNEFDTAKAQGKTCPGIPGDVIRRWYFDRDEAAIAPYIAKPTRVLAALNGAVPDLTSIA